MKEKANKIWYFFRSGYSTYLAFAFGFSNFLLLLYGLTPLKDKIGLVEFGVISSIVLIPAAVIIGIFHNRTQTPVEQKIAAHINPYKDKILPDSKETFSNDYNVFGLNNTIWSIKTNLWNMRHTEWNLDKFIHSNEHAIFNISLTKKNMTLLNKMIKQIIPNIEKHEIYTDAEMKRLDEYKDGLTKQIVEARIWIHENTIKMKELEEWLKGFVLWEKAFVELGKGVSVQEAAKHMVDGNQT